MNNPKLRTYLARALGVVAAAVMLQGLSGCSGGAEAQKPLPAPSPKAPPAGGSVDEYKSHMQDAAKKMGH